SYSDLGEAYGFRGNKLFLLSVCKVCRLARDPPNATSTGGRRVPFDRALSGSNCATLDRRTAVRHFHPPTSGCVGASWPDDQVLYSFCRQEHEATDQSRGRLVSIADCG